MNEFRSWLLLKMDQLDREYDSEPHEGLWERCAGIARQAGDRAARLGRADLFEQSHKFQVMAEPLDAKAFLAACLNACQEPARRPDFSARFLTIEDSAAFVGLSTESIRRMLASGKLTALRPVKGRIVLDRLQLEGVVLSSDPRPRKGRGLKS